MNLTVLVLRNVDCEASSRSASSGSWEIMITQTGAERGVSVLVSWYTTSTEPFLRSTSTSSSTTSMVLVLDARWETMERAISSVENPLSGYPLSKCLRICSSTPASELLRQFT